MASSFGIQAPKAPQKPRVGRIAMNRGLALEGLRSVVASPIVWRESELVCKYF